MFYSYESSVSAAVWLSTLDDTGMVFKVRAESDVHLQMTRYQGTTSVDTYEAVIGGWGNMKSAIRSVVQGTNVCERDTPGILSKEAFRYFWVSWKGGVIAIGEGNVLGDRQICSWTDVAPHAVTAIKFLTESGHRGTWDISEISR
jgi:hypothetical protein